MCNLNCDPKKGGCSELPGSPCKRGKQKCRFGGNPNFIFEIYSAPQFIFCEQILGEMLNKGRFQIIEEAQEVN